MPRPIRFGIAGCCAIGPTHAEAIAGLPEAKLVAAADVIPERAEALAARYGATPYPDLRAMLERENLDVVNICTPSGMHGEHACEAMRAGCHVVVEKPMEISGDAIDEMLRTQRETGSKLGVIFQHRFDPASRRVRSLIDENAFGRLILGNAHVIWWRSQGYYDADGWRGTWELDGGVLMNQAIHSIDLLLWFMGPVRSVTAYTVTLAHDMEAEDTAVAALRFENGAPGAITATTAAYPGVTTRIEIFGDRGSAVIEKDRLTYLHLARDDAEEVGPYGLEMAPASPVPDAPDDSGPDQVLNAHARQIQDMIDAIRQDREPLVNGEVGRQAVDLVLAIYESARIGREVAL